MMPKTLRVVLAGEVFTAALNPDAPLTVAAFVKLLPYRQKMIHVRWSGEACWIPLGEFQLGVGFENHTSHPAPGDVLFYPGGYSETELLIRLRRLQLRQPHGAPGGQPLHDASRQPRQAARARPARAVGRCGGRAVRG